MAIQNILLTSGGTKVAIDRVRHIGNMSRGTFGAAIGRQILQQTQFANLHFLMAKGSRSPFQETVNWAEGLEAETAFARLKFLRSLHLEHASRYVEYEYEDFAQYERLLRSMVGWMDLVILAAAVSDYGVANYVDGKIRSKDALTIQLEPLPKLISVVKSLNPNVRLVGFKLLVDSTVDELLAAAKDSCVKNGCDLVVANDLRDIRAGQHRLLLVNSHGLVADVPSHPDNPEYLAEVVAREALKL